MFAWKGSIRVNLFNLGGKFNLLRDLGAIDFERRSVKYLMSRKNWIYKAHCPFSAHRTLCIIKKKSRVEREKSLRCLGSPD